MQSPLAALGKAGDAEHQRDRQRRQASSIPITTPLIAALMTVIASILYPLEA